MAILRVKGSNKRGLYPTQAAQATTTNRTYTKGMIRHEVLVWIYGHIHAAVDSCIDVIGSETGFLEHFVVDCYLKVATGKLRNSAIFQSPEELALVGYPGGGGRSKGIEEHAVMLVGMEFMYDIAMKEQGVRLDVHRQMKPKLPWVKAVWTVLTQSFLRSVEGYIRTIDSIASIDEKRANAGSISERTLYNLNILERNAQEVERRVGGTRNTLYGVIVYVRRRMLLVDYYHEKIMCAYDKMIAQMARAFGRSTEQIRDNHQYGQIGFLRSMIFFEPARNRALSGIGRWWVRAAILLTLKNEANPVTIPNGFWQWHEKFEKKALELGIVGEDNIETIAAAFNRTAAQVEEVYDAVRLNRPVSIETSLSSDESNDGRVGDNIPDTSPGPDVELAEADTQIPAYMQTLSPIEQYVVCCSYGLLDHIPDLRGKEKPADAFAERLRQLALSVREV